MCLGERVFPSYQISTKNLTSLERRLFMRSIRFGLLFTSLHASTRSNPSLQLILIPVVLNHVPVHSRVFGTGHHQRSDAVYGHNLADAGFAGALRQLASSHPDAPQQVARSA